MAGGGFIAARLAGTSLADCLFTTRAQLKASIAGVAGGVDALAGKLAGARAYFSGRVDDLAADQAALGTAVGRVGEDLARARADVAAVHGEVRGLAAGMASLEAGQREARAALNLANEGVFLLCRVVCDLMRAGPADKRGKPVSDAAAALDEYVRRPAGLACALQGGGTRGRGSLLGGGAFAGLDDAALGLGSGLGVYGAGPGAASSPSTSSGPATPGGVEEEEVHSSFPLGCVTQRPLPATAGAFNWLF